MKKLITALVAAGFVTASGIASAEKPVPLTGVELDTVSAGWKIRHYVRVKVKIKGNKATALATADAIGTGSLSATETFAYTIQGGGSSSGSSSLAASSGYYYY